jgi:hypothetical protein
MLFYSSGGFNRDPNFLTTDKHSHGEELEPQMHTDEQQSIENRK